jgi:hypothetical protein
VNKLHSRHALSFTMKGWMAQRWIQSRGLSTAMWRIISSRAQWLTPILPTTWEAEIGRIAIWGQPKRKVSKTLLQPMVVHTCGLSYMGGPR